MRLVDQLGATGQKHDDLVPSQLPDVSQAYLSRIMRDTHLEQLHQLHQ
jgi:hypothetical protein